MCNHVITTDLNFHKIVNVVMDRAWRDFRVRLCSRTGKCETVSNYSNKLMTSIASLGTNKGRRTPIISLHKSNQIWTRQLANKIVTRLPLPS